MQAKIAYAGANNTSYEQGDADLRELADLTVGSKQVRRICKWIGGERCVERDQAVATYQALPLVQRKETPPGVTAPEVAVVEVDGGRLQIFDRSANAPAANSPASDPASTDDHPDERADHGRHWREDKIGLLMTVASELRTTDPCPEIPANFVNPLRIMKLARELKKRVPLGEEAAKPAASDAAADNPLDAGDSEEWKRPEVVSKRFAATRRPWEEFGPMVATRAWEWGFYGATRKAFVGDGAANNWTMWRSHFSSFTPILDFIHALSYVFAAATAGRPFAEGWECYVKWIAWVWQGQGEQVIDELARRQEELGGAAQNESARGPHQVVASALEYLRNNAMRMKYAEYRRDGLPITSSYVESAVKQFNYRVKGTEKFWDEEGAEGILQLRGDFLSDDRPLDDFWKRREANESGQRRYRKAS